MSKPTILVFTAGYLPGYRAGGPIRSIANLVDSLGDKYSFKIITSVFDLGTVEPYKGIVANTWIKNGKADVFYATKTCFKFRNLLKLIRSIKCDAIYLNSFFNYDYSIKPLILRFFMLLPDINVILAPRGEFSLGALRIKGIKKNVFMFFARILGLYKNILWQASSVYEKDDIKNIFINGMVEVGAPIIVAPDLSNRLLSNSIQRTTIKDVGTLSIVFLSRISPKKNLDGALSILKDVNGEITFNVYGPIEDVAYLKSCKGICSSLPSNIKVVFCGEVEHSCVDEIFRGHHLFFFPTHGENFGHVILESILAGCPVLLSDQTPWKNLSSLGIGWEFSLNNPENFREAIDRLVLMDQVEFNKLSQRTMAYGFNYLNSDEILDQNINLFELVINDKRSDRG